ncbi:hypothetical protein [Burkholderia ambifaria]|uniref:hypothetical protein n=1 Tax=Burkholderia ambifaria TaxID=152480 RepID=UPI001BA1E29A|nr:hypothetical protein [Burkholderia ambifaria]MBR8257577.1 hypothetical protein [Burkholderia ambifaria]
MYSEHDKKRREEPDVRASREFRARSGSVDSNYQKLLQHPTSMLVGSVDDSPQSFHVAILGYN